MYRHSSHKNLIDFSFLVFSHAILYSGVVFRIQSALKCKNSLFGYRYPFVYRYVLITNSNKSGYSMNLSIIRRS